MRLHRFLALGALVGASVVVASSAEASPRAERVERLHRERGEVLLHRPVDPGLLPFHQRFHWPHRTIHLLRRPEPHPLGEG